MCNSNLPTFEQLPELITMQQICDALGFAKSTVYKYRKILNFPDPIKYGHTSRWLKVEVCKWALSPSDYLKNNGGGEK